MKTLSFLLLWKQIQAFCKKSHRYKRKYKSNKSNKLISQFLLGEGKKE